MLHENENEKENAMQHTPHNQTKPNKTKPPIQ